MNKYKVTLMSGQMNDVVHVIAHNESEAIGRACEHSGHPGVKWDYATIEEE